MMTRAIVTDIEGTTSSIRFVHDVLFPYAAAKLPQFVREHHNEPAVAAILSEVAELAGVDNRDSAALIEQLLQWIAEDRKLTPLKSLQGLIWQAGYEGGDYSAHVYDDAVKALRQWHARGLPLYVYSSGSIHAQKLFFHHSVAGDLLPLFSGHFDTSIGAKREVESYRRITQQIGLPAPDILFLSDIVEELDAAHEAGLQTCWIQRDSEIVTHTHHSSASSFDEIPLEN